MKNLTIINQNGIFTVDSREVAEMVEKNHADLLRSIKVYAGILTESNFALSGFFIESIYQDSTGRSLPCYLITKKGCDMVANKMTGEKGVLFTAMYVTKFEEMEQTLKAPALKPMTQAEILAGLAQVTVEIERTANMAIEVANKASRQITNALDVFTAPTADNWKHDMNSKINQIVESQGFNHQKFRGDLYEELECLAHCDITARQNNLRKRLKGQGAKYKDCQAVSKLEVIDGDIHLKPIFDGIVRKYQVKYASMSCAIPVPYSEN